jgi:hypothetical protein
MSFFGMVKHFVFDLLHFDGKFFSTLITLFAKPGKVPFEYVQGKRVRYLEPFRMYIFSSSFFFILFFSFFSDKQPAVKIKAGEDKTVQTQPNGDSTISHFMINDFVVDTFADYKMLKADFEIRNPGKHMRWIDRMVLQKYYSYPLAVRSNEKYFGQLLLDEAVHKIPHIFFCILPFFVWLLKLLYFKNKNYVYSDHGIFALYMFSFGFLFMLGVQFFSLLSEAYFSKALSSLSGFLFFILFNTCFFMALKRFYGQSFIKTVIKFLLLALFNLMIALIIFVLYYFIVFLIL